MTTTTFILILISFINNICYAYLEKSQINALTDLYKSLNVNKWTFCTWNITQLSINKTLPSYYCGLGMYNITNNIQTVYAISFEFEDDFHSIDFLTFVVRLSLFC